jgi:acetyl-CoA synthetase
MMRITSFQAYQDAYQKSIESPDEFWEEVAQHFSWRQPWQEILSGNFATAQCQWFRGAKLNITDNAIDRHALSQPHQMALIWEPNDPQTPARSFTYFQLQQQVMKVAEMLRKMGVKKGDRVCIYMGMVPELTFAVLACARIGAIHSVIFGGFSAKSIADRLEDAGARFIITMDAAQRGSKIIPLKSVVDEALSNGFSIQKVLVLIHQITCQQLVGLVVINLLL